MKRLLFALAAVLVLGACGSTNNNKDKDPDPTTASTPTAGDGDDAVFEPGRFGEVTMGMTVDEAIATGLLAAGTGGPEGCPVPELVWKSPFDKQVDVYLNDKKRIVSIGTVNESPAKTSEGIGLGSKLSDVQAAYPHAREPAAAGYGQSGVIVEDDRGYLGFLFDPPPDQVGAESEVRFIEVTAANEPALIRDGC